MEKYDAIVIGGGPGGLSCAKMLSLAGTKVVVLERKRTIGTKVCAGGITWDGLIRKVPGKLIERTFNEQRIFSRCQNFCFRKKNPIIATINRAHLGQWMLQDARNAGAEIRTGWHVRAIESGSVTAMNNQGKSIQLGCNHLVGADGSTSMVRNFLGIPTVLKGIGINYQIPGHYEHMEWHLNTGYFGNGYGWIFPHRQSVSIGSYSSGSNMAPKHLQRQLIRWAASRGFKLDKEPARAELINYDYRGYHFGRTWLVGDAAGLASGLTGEGIHPAVISGAAVARKILDPSYPADEIDRLVAKKKRHERLVHVTGRSGTICAIMMEILILMIRLKMVDFQEQLSM